jgi:predicted TIM-barrel fold metal-dependent hydrolase
MIDFHVMVLPPEQRQLQAQEVPDECDGIREILSNDADRAWVAETDSAKVIEAMDEAEIEMAVIMGWPWQSQDRCNACNAYVADSIARYPGRFIGLTVVSPRDAARAVEELEHCLDAGFAGLKIKPQWQGFELDDQAVMGPLLDLLVERGKLLMTHVAQPYQSPAGDHPHQLHNLLAAYPTLDIVASHLGGMYGLYYAHLPFQKRFDHLYFDIAFNTFSAVLPSYLDLLPDGHLLFGSDHPFLPSQGLLAKLAALNLPAHQAESLLDGTARSLLRKCGIKLERPYS